jgi:Rieske 2Fe-2S family protein
VLAADPKAFTTDEGEGSRLRSLLLAEPPGRSFSQPFYVSPELLGFEREMLQGQWLYAAHASELPHESSYREVSVLGESIILTRLEGGAFGAYYNVCRHRGSRILEPGQAGHGPLLVCPYHGWSYGRDGALVVAPSMGEGLSCSELALTALRTFALEGMIFVAEPQAALPPDTIGEACGALWAYHGLADARIAERIELEVEANWKLAVENFLECYHCLPNHPQLCTVYDHVLVSGSTDPGNRITYMRAAMEWSKRVQDLGTPTAPLKRINPQHDQFALCYRMGIRKGFDTLSSDGRPVAPLMGRFPAFDGGETFGFVGPFLHYSLANDHAVLITVEPREAERTTVKVAWLVAAHAEKERDYEPERLRWLWESTVRQDCALVARAQQGLRSRGYRPGPYGPLETDLQGFKRWYLRLAQAHVLGERA